MNRRKQGAEGEALAARYLEQQGYTILQHNYRYGRGEIDLVAREGNELVFVEVKLRRSTRLGDPEEAVTPAKQNQIRRVAEGYYYEHQIERQTCRFDVVAITYRNGTPHIRLLRDAFS
ncbi:MAG: YraN family protein [Bacteroidota bacterium]|jgi:putative endonuclease